MWSSASSRGASTDDVLACANGRRGAGLLGELIADLDDDPGLTVNDLEDRFLESSAERLACRSRRSTDGSKSTTGHAWELISRGLPTGPS